MRTHNQTEVSRIERCHMDYDQEDGCPLCIAERRALAAEADRDRLREALRNIEEETTDETALDIARRALAASEEKEVGSV